MSRRDLRIALFVTTKVEVQFAQADKQCTVAGASDFGNTLQKLGDLKSNLSALFFICLRGTWYVS